MATHKAIKYITQEDFHMTFMIARSAAIEHYANLEQILASLCAHLMNVPVDVSGVMFFKINNARARLAILERLLKKKYENKYNIFWNSLVKELRPIDEKRNQIVHWITEKTGTSQGKQWSALVSPNYWDRTEHSESIYIDDLYDFIMKSYFLYFMIQYFIFVISDSPKKIDSAWPEIFSQPIVYPPPDSHPISRILQ